MRKKPERTADDERRLRLIGANIRAERARRNLKQDKVAFDSEMAVAAYARLERGETNGGILGYLNIAKALGIELSEILRDVK